MLIERHGTNTGVLPSLACETAKVDELQPLNVDRSYLCPLYSCKVTLSGVVAGEVLK